MKKIFIVTGQTATGKTEKALELAAQEQGEVVNCDSRQIYRYLDIISGKDLPRLETQFKTVKNLGDFTIGYYDYTISPFTGKPLPGIKVWLYDIITPNQSFSSFDYATCALTVIENILRRNKTPIIVGGTYFYLQHLLYDVVDNQVPPDQELRKQLEALSISQLQKKLKQINPGLFKTLNESDRANPYRLMRKIEISSHQKDYKQQDPTYIFTLANKLHVKNLLIDYQGLRYRDKTREEELIKKRVEKRLREHCVQEVEKLLQRGFDEDQPGMQTIGYQQIIQYLKGRMNKQDALKLWTLREMQYAKRQYTFMKKDPNIVWREV